MTARRKRLLVKLVAAAGVCWLAVCHWPAAPLLFAAVTGTQPGNTARAYAFRFYPRDATLRALGRGSIHEGQPLAEVVERFGPFRTTTAGPWTEIIEPGNSILAFAGWVMIARDGRMVYAIWHTDTKPYDTVFFDALTPDERQDCRDQFEARLTRLREDRQGAYMSAAGAAGFHAQWPVDEYRREGERAAGRAVAGAAGWAAYHDPPYQTELSP